MKRLISLSLGLATLLLASQAFAFGAAVAARVSAPGVARIAPGSIARVSPGSIPGVKVNGAVMVRGIIVLPNGKLLVPAVTPRMHGLLAPAPRLGPGMSTLTRPVSPCRYSDCGP